MAQFELDGHIFIAERLVDGVLVNPGLPTKSMCRSADEFARWLMRPFVLTERYERPKNELLHEELSAAWERAWPTGVKFDVRCVDHAAGGEYSRWGCFPTLEEALECIRMRREVALGAMGTRL